MKSKIIVAHDIEKTGCLIHKHPIVSLGFCVADDQGDILNKKRFDFIVNWPSGDTFGDFEPRCWDQFWSTLPRELIEDFKINAEPQEQQWKNVDEFLNDLELKYPESQYDIVFITDNASFDTANIDYNLERYANRKPMRYAQLTGSYRSVLDVDYTFDSVCDSDDYKWCNQHGFFDHDPVNDAHFVYLKFLRICTKLKNTMQTLL